MMNRVLISLLLLVSCGMSWGAQASTPATLTSPLQGVALSGSSVNFTWSTGSGVTLYQLLVGTHGAGTYDVFGSSYITSTSLIVNGIPTGGGTLYVRLRSYINGAWQFSDYTFTESGTASAAQLTAPVTPVLSGSSVNFTWSTGSGVTLYQLLVGTHGAGTYDVFGSSYFTSTSLIVGNIPTGGGRLYVRLRSFINGAWQFNDYTFTESGTAAKAQLTTPSAGSVTGPSVSFGWTAGSGVALYHLLVGTTGAGSSNIFSSGYVPSTSLNVSGIPVAGAGTLFVRLRSYINGAWQWNDYTFTYGGWQVSGNVFLSNNCGSNGNSAPITVTLGTTPPKVTTTDGFGHYNFSPVPNGTYSVTPSITGPTSIFSPATQNVTVSGGNATVQDIGAVLGYTVSGTVAYAGAQTGRTYVMLSPSNCGGNPLGVSLATPGAFTVRGVPPGTYSLAAWTDSLGFGYPDASDASGTVSNVTVSNANLTGQTVTMTDPVVTIPAAPSVNAITPTDLGVVINFKAVTTTLGNGIQVEVPTSYQVGWSTSPTFATIAGNKSFAAGGANGTGVLILNNQVQGLSSNFVNSTTYYFRVRAVNSAGHSPWTVFGGAGTATPIVVGAPTGGNTVTGTVTFTGEPNGPLYVGFYNVTNGQVNATSIANPVSPQAFSVNVPTGSTYYFFAVIDQNNDGMIDAGDTSNTHGELALTAISGPTSGLNLTLPAAGSSANVTTMHWKQTNNNGTYTGYNVNFDVREGNLLPVAVTLTAGPNSINPIDIGKCIDCGSAQFQYWVPLNSVTPTVGDTYTFHVTYSNGTEEDKQPAVTGVLNAFTTNMTPSGAGAGTTPTFSWTDPANASSYTYQFYLQANNGGTVWSIPGNNSNSKGFSSSVTSITWGTDPTDGSNPPSVGSLTVGTGYTWSLTAQDSNGNGAQTQVNFQP